MVNKIILIRTSTNTVFFKTFKKLFFSDENRFSEFPNRENAAPPNKIIIGQIRHNIIIIHHYEVKIY